MLFMGLGADTLRDLGAIICYGCGAGMLGVRGQIC